MSWEWPIEAENKKKTRSDQDTNRFVALDFMVKIGFAYTWTDGIVAVRKPITEGIIASAHLLII